MPPLVVCLIGALLFGAVLGAVANWATSTYAWFPQQVSAWSAAPEGAAPRSWLDRIPIWGWWRLRREAPWQPTRFWVRPLIVELAMSLGIALLFWWEVDQQGLVAEQLTRLPAAPRIAVPVSVPVGPLMATFFAHAILVTFMAAASLVDIDEKIIPDEFTVIGALIGLTLATCIPMALLPYVAERSTPIAASTLVGEPQGFFLKPGQQIYVEPTTVNAPRAWPPAWLAPHSVSGLAIAVGCYFGWLLALTPRRWRGRRGLLRGASVLLARIIHELKRPPLSVIACAGLAGIVGVWFAGGAPWLGLVTALVGMIGSGALVWATRIAGSQALGVEAMGFGDVTLMMMVGAFVGWQAGVIVFFVAPFAGLAAGILQLVLRGGNVIPYGPYLCLGTLAVIVGWARVWTETAAIFSVPWLAPAVLAFVMAMLWAMLVLMRVVRTTFTKG